jgi:hypothetical protein
MSLLNRRQHGFQFPHYFHFAEPAPRGAVLAFGAPIPEDDMEDAAEALRGAELDAAQPGDTVADLPPLDVIESMKITLADLETMSIDELRAVANALDIPDRSKITEKAELIEEILRRV